MNNKIILFFFFCSVFLFAQSHKDMIEGPFSNPQEVTEQCLTCHESSAKEIMKTSHWTWLDEKFVDANNDTLQMGKRNFINNFCIALPSNYPRCTSCHIGYGWKDSNYDFNNEKNVDCLVCHDLSGTYKKTPTGAGMPDPKVDLLVSAQSVGKPTRKNCGTCHFDGGGGTGVKHGDLDDSLYEPAPETDVHMGKLDFQCHECHSSTGHVIKGASHGSMAAGQNHIYCTDCHEGAIHKYKLIDRHSNSVACKTCHIPVFAKVRPTKVWWDWSKAGEDKTQPKDEFGEETYNKMKGEFRWAKNVIPTYKWYNGSASYYKIGDKIESGKILALNKPNGNIKDPKAKIAPFKVMRGKQIYDPQNKYLIVPKLYGEDGYWKTYDWNKAAKIGMKEVNLDYSGNYDFIETEMYWPINHMVAPKEEALKCKDCHSTNGRLDWKELGYKGDPRKIKGRKLDESK
ncbi:tetrathionate reductase family octaheme c-type cytochrome [Melioribacter sp. OK-6-Me]|uniref:tetrathionate reductase family octaheme c-type cytochrome n=1 Tax=unclassified Melioribacter TaxID=2627329 RepID=UPI003EDA7B4C